MKNQSLSDIIASVTAEYKNSSSKAFIIAIDGRSASGKTTFASKLASAINAPVIHTDDFCRPRDAFGNLNLSEFDGNFDIERFKTEVLSSIRSGNGFNYGIFDCKIGAVTKTAICPTSKCYIIEGAYSLHPSLGDYADLKVFFDISPKLQSERIVMRNGESGAKNYFSVWIPAEERYISNYNIISRADIIINLNGEKQ